MRKLVWFYDIYVVYMCYFFHLSENVSAETLAIFIKGGTCGVNY